MGLISSTHAVSRYHVDGEIEGPLLEFIRSRLIKNAIPESDSEYDEISAGWTPIESPYQPDFETFSFQFGTYFLFSLRIDKKSIPAKLVQKHMTIEIEKKKKTTGRDFISKNEKSELKEMVIDILMSKIPAVPNIYDILWQYEEKNLYFFSTQNAANEFFETLFLKTFKLKPIRLFPYTIFEKKSDLKGADKDRVLTLTPFNYKR